MNKEFEIIAHNMANVSTTGFKRRCNSFTNMLESQQASQDGQTQEEDSLSGVFDFSQGTLVQTDRTLDFALDGSGFFVIETPTGPLYTRHGVFHTDASGHIVDSAGRLVAGTSGPLTVPGNVDLSSLQISNDGQIMAGEASIGQFHLVEFPKAQDQLQPAGENCFTVPDTVKPVDATETFVKQGYQEASNVKLVDELVNMILVSRMYESNMRLVSVKRDSTSSAMSVAMG
ncbi:MAG: flagellar hook-basal body protein [Solirubrobacterales bacterium]